MKMIQRLVRRQPPPPEQAPGMTKPNRDDTDGGRDVRPAAAPSPKRRPGMRLPLAILVLCLLATIGVWLTGPPRAYLTAAGWPDLGPAPIFMAGDIDLDDTVLPSAAVTTTLPSRAGEPVLDSGLETSALTESLSPQPSGPDPILIARIDALETSLAALRKDIHGQPDISPAVVTQLDEIRATATAQGTQIETINDQAQQALRTAREVASDFRLGHQSSEVDSESIRQDVRAVFSRITRLEERFTSQDGRIEALAGDIHLLSRYGGAPEIRAVAQPSTAITAAPFLVNAAPGATHVSVPTPPPDIIQGHYRVGDWVGGYGVVTAIRKTPEGDHLVTPAGVVFAPAPALSTVSPQ